MTLHQGIGISPILGIDSNEYPFANGPMRSDLSLCLDMAKPFVEDDSISSRDDIRAFFRQRTSPYFSMANPLSSLAVPTNPHLLGSNDRLLADCKGQIFDAIAKADQEQRGDLLDKILLLSSENLHELHQKALKMSADRIITIERETGRKCKALGIAKKHLASSALYLAFFCGSIKVSMALARQSKIFSSTLIIGAIAFAALHLAGFLLSSLYLWSKAARLAELIEGKELVDRAQRATMLVSEQLIKALVLSSNEEKSGLKQRIHQLTDLTNQQNATIASRVIEIASLQSKINRGAQILTRQKDAIKAVQPLVDQTLTHIAENSMDTRKNFAEQSAMLPNKMSPLVEKSPTGPIPDDLSKTAHPSRSQIAAQGSQVVNFQKPDLISSKKEVPSDKSVHFSLHDDLFEANANNAEKEIPRSSNAGVSNPLKKATDLSSAPPPTNEQPIGVLNELKGQVLSASSHDPLTLESFLSSALLKKENWGAKKGA